MGIMFEKFDKIVTTLIVLIAAFLVFKFLKSVILLVIALAILAASLLGIWLKFNGNDEPDS